MPTMAFALRIATGRVRRRMCRIRLSPEIRRLLRGLKGGAGKGNRTPLASLEGWSITTMLYPLGLGAIATEAAPASTRYCVSSLASPSSSSVSVAKLSARVGFSTSAGCSAVYTSISTRRFASLPSSFGEPSGSALGAAGFCSPKAMTEIRLRREHERLACLHHRYRHCHCVHEGRSLLRRSPAARQVRSPAQPGLPEKVRRHPER